jgi:protein-S-isoprenylcysteine O-methyltransferase Ste14
MAPNQRRPRKRDAALGSLVFLFAAPGMVGGVVPWIISRWRVRDYEGAAFFRLLGIVLILFGLAVLIEAFGRFALQGRGTPAPIYPTDRLVVGGTYRFVRNPMYIAVESLILGQAAYFGSSDLIIYGAIIAVAFHLFVVWVEEPTLRRSFPADYRRYSSAVHRWVPRLTPWRPES